MGQSKMDNPEKLETWGIQDTGQSTQKHTTQYALDTTTRKQTQLT